MESGSSGGTLSLQKIQIRNHMDIVENDGEGEQSANFGRNITL